MGTARIFHLSTDGRVLRCAPTDRDDPIWQRVLLDTVLWTVSLLRGYEQLHASAVRTADGVIAFTAGSGGGKTSLAAEFLRRGRPCTPTTSSPSSSATAASPHIAGRRS